MKITHNKVGQNLNVRDNSKAEKSEKSGAAGAITAKDLGAGKAEANNEAAGASKVNLSGRAQDLKRVKELATAAPDVDEAKVARLQKLIDEGKYKVDSEAIAGKMLDEHMSWE